MNTLMIFLNQCLTDDAGIALTITTASFDLLRNSWNDYPSTSTEQKLSFLIGAITEKCAEHNEQLPVIQYHSIVLLKCMGFRLAGFALSLIGGLLVSLLGGLSV